MRIIPHIKNHSRRAKILLTVTFGGRSIEKAACGVFRGCLFSATAVVKNGAVTVRKKPSAA